MTKKGKIGVKNSSKFDNQSMTPNVQRVGISKGEN